MAEPVMPFTGSRERATSRPVVALLVLVVAAVCAPLSFGSGYAARIPVVRRWWRRRRTRVLAAAEQADAVERAQAFGRLSAAGRAEWGRGSAWRARS
jgi:hypothetical protein